MHKSSDVILYCSYFEATSGDYHTFHEKLLPYPIYFRKFQVEPTTQSKIIKTFNNKKNKIAIILFWNQKGVMLVDFSQLGNADGYCETLRPTVAELCLSISTLVVFTVLLWRKGFLICFNGTFLIIRHIVVRNDFHLLLELKKWLGRQSFQIDDELRDAAPWKPISTCTPVEQMSQFDWGLCW